MDALWRYIAKRIRPWNEAPTYKSARHPPLEACRISQHVRSTFPADSGKVSVMPNPRAVDANNLLPGSNHYESTHLSLDLAGLQAARQCHRLSDVCDEATDSSSQINLKNYLILDVIFYSSILRSTM